LVREQIADRSLSPWQAPSDFHLPAKASPPCVGGKIIPPKMSAHQYRPLIRLACEGKMIFLYQLCFSPWLPSVTVAASPSQRSAEFIQPFSLSVVNPESPSLRFSACHGRVIGIPIERGLPFKSPYRQLLFSNPSPPFLWLARAAQRQF